MGNTIALEITWEGTHTGPLEMPTGAIPATGKSISLQGAWVMEVAGDQTRESRNYFDLMSLLRAIGAVPGASWS